MATGNCALKKGQELQHFVCGGVLPERRQVLNWGSGQLSESPPSPLLRQIHMAAGRLLTEVLTCFSQTRIPAGKYSGQSHPDKQHWNLNHGVFKSIRLKFNTINNWQSLHKLCYENICGPIFLTISVPVPGHYWNDSLQFPFPNFGKIHFSFPPHSQTSGMGEFW